MNVPKLVCPLALISLHQWGWGLHGYFTGSGLSLSGLDWDQEWDWPGDATARTLGQAPPVRAWLCWELLVGVGSWEGELGALLHSGAVPSAKKRMRSEGKSGSLPNSSSTLNQTCFLSFSFSSFCREASHYCALSMESQDLGCNLRFSMEWWSHSSAEWDSRGLGDGDLSLTWAWRGGAFIPPQHTPSPRTGSSPTQPGLSVLVFHLKGLILFNWTQECLWLLEGNSAGPLLLCRPVLVMHLESSLCSSFMKSSCCTWVNMLDTTIYLPL